MAGSLINVKVLLHLKKCVADRLRKSVLFINPYNIIISTQNSTLKSPNGRTSQRKLSFEIGAEIFLSVSMYVCEHLKQPFFFDF